MVHLLAPLPGVVAGAAGIAVGEGLIAFGVDIFLVEINAFLGTNIAAPGDFLPFPRFEPIFKESIFDKIRRLTRPPSGDVSFVPFCVIDREKT